jgi:membrane associated rhomboid family serine protease
MINLNFTLIIVIITSLISITAFQNREVFDKLKFNPWMIRHRKEWVRFITHGFIHVDTIHLIINMYVLYSFGSIAEDAFKALFHSNGRIIYLGLYLLAIPASSLFSYLKNKNNDHYNAVGASGAVSAVVFSSIIFIPKGGIGLLFLPIPIPSYIFGLLYLVYSAIMAKRAKDNIGHDAHFWGAIFGILFTFAVKPQLIEYFFKEIIR